MYLFRRQKGGFEESMRDLRPFKSMDEIKINLEKELGGTIDIESYGFDDRLNSDCYIVLHNYKAIGFMHYA
ncbi:MAG: hypothetical protein GY941_10555 [Planctomycetes bacterium]|nr:hypothetical protein [Planctomycetota bacterium]